MTNEEKLVALGPARTPDFCVTLDFPKGTHNPQRLFKSAAAYIDALQSLDGLLLSSVDVQIKPVFVLEDIEIGSLKFWLKQVLETVNDNALENLDWKPAVGKYLVKCKYLFIKALEGKKTLTDREKMEALTAEFHVLAQETGVLRLPAYRTVSPSDLAQEAKKIGESMKDLGPQDTITFQSDDGDIVLEPGLVITQEDITNLFADTFIINEIERILMVRKPDFLGESMWEFRHEKRAIAARIVDSEWLAGYHAGKIDIRPGDALRVKLRESVTHDRSGEVIKEDREIVKVLGITKPPMQSSLI